MDGWEDFKTQADDFVTDLGDGLVKGDPFYIGIVTAILSTIITLLFLLLRGSSSKKTSVLLVGLCDAGKTLLFSRLIYGKHQETFTSIKENKATYKLPNNKGKSVTLLDLPGHERVRNTFIDKHKNNARALLFVVDSLTLQKEIKDVAEYLYTLLTDKVIMKSAMPILIVCNKQDQTMAKGAKVIQSQLQKEINTLRITKSAALQGTDDSSSGNVFLGRRDRDFCFEDLRSHKIEFVEAAARARSEGDEVDIDSVEDWLCKVL